MEPWLRDIIDWLPTGGLLYTLIGLISFVESLAFVGIFCPGSIFIVLAGFLAAQGSGNFPVVAAVSAAGAVGGDLVSYFLGARMAGAVLRLGPFRKRKELLYKSQIFFVEHGGKSVFFGRFVGFLRPFIPFVAGSSHMSPPRFTLYAVISGILWGIAYPGLGYFFGASWQLVRVWTGRFSLFFTALLLLVVLNTLFWQKLLPRLAPRLSNLWARIAADWRQLLQTPAILGFAGRHPRLWALLADRFSLHHGAGLYLTLGLTLSALFALLFLWLATNIPLLARIDVRFYTLLQESRHPAVDTAMLVITCLGSVKVVAMLAALVLLWLVLGNRDFSALILLVGLTGGELLVSLLKVAFDRPRPIPFLTGLQTFSASLPSGHAFTALVFYGLVVYFFLDHVANWRSRLHLVLSGSLLATLIGYSRVYLGVHWLSDVLTGFALAAVWLTFLVTASELRRRYGGEFPWGAGRQPVRLSRKSRAVILTLAALGALGGAVFYVLNFLSQN